jgi:hypothetical protein
LLNSSQVVNALAGLGLKPSQQVKEGETFDLIKFKQIVLAASSAS